MENENQFMMRIKGFYYCNACVFWKDFLYEAKMTYDKSEEKVDKDTALAWNKTKAMRSKTTSLKFLEP